MIALPSPMIEACVDAASPAGKAARPIWELAGAPAVIDDLLRSNKVDEWSEVVRDETQGDRRHVVLLLKPNGSYRRIGGFIYRMQSLSVDFTSRFAPPICGMDQN